MIVCDKSHTGGAEAEVRIEARRGLPRLRHDRRRDLHRVCPGLAVLFQNIRADERGGKQHMAQYQSQHRIVLPMGGAGVRRQEAVAVCREPARGMCVKVA
jgi:hypothetical protein